MAVVGDRVVDHIVDGRRGLGVLRVLERDARGATEERHELATGLAIPGRVVEVDLAAAAAEAET